MSRWVTRPQECPACHPEGLTGSRRPALGKSPPDPETGGHFEAVCCDSSAALHRLLPTPAPTTATASDLNSRPAPRPSSAQQLRKPAQWHPCLGPLPWVASLTPAYPLGCPPCRLFPTRKVTETHALPASHLAWPRVSGRVWPHACTPTLGILCVGPIRATNVFTRTLIGRRRF